MFCLKITHAVIDFDRCLHFRFMIYKHAFSFFLPCLSFFFFFFSKCSYKRMFNANIKDHITRVYMHILCSAISSSYHTYYSTTLLGNHDGDCVPHKSSNPSSLPSKIRLNPNLNYKLIIFRTGFLSLSALLCVGVGNALISPGNFTDSSICTVNGTP